MAKTDTLRKLATKTIMQAFDVEDWQKIPDGQNEKFLYSIAGTAIGVKKGEGSYGPWTRFNGEFIAMSPEGEIVQGAACFLPEPMQSQIEAALSHADSKGVEFAIEIWIRPPTDDENVKYVYVTKPVVKLQESSRTKHLLEQMTNKMKERKALPAPKAAEKPAAKSGK